MTAWIAPVFLAHLGCANRCVFCNQHLITGDAGAPSQQEVRERLEGFFRCRKKRAATVSQIAFYGGSFTSLERSLQETYLSVAQEYVKRGWVDSVRVSTRPDELSDDQVAFLADRSVRTIEIGIQSLSDRVLAESRRGHGSREAVEALLRVRGAGLEAGAQIMLGLPGDTGAESLETVETLCALKPDFARIYPVLVLRGTELAERMGQGLYRPLSLEEAVSLAARVLERFRSVSIPVIRIGLQEADGLRPADGSVLGGPYHPAFGHLVRCRAYYWRTVAAVRAQLALPCASIRLKVHPRDRSLLAGYRSSHWQPLRRDLGLARIEIEEDAGLPRGGVECAGR